MSDIQVTVEPSHLELRPGEAAEVVVSIASTHDSGRVIFPVHSGSGNGTGILNLSTVIAAVFMKPRTEPGNLPVTIEELSSDANSATFRVTALAAKLSGRDKRKLKG